MQGEKRPLNRACVLGAALLSFSAASCATTPKLPPPPPKYIYQQSAPEQQKRVYADNSLWTDGASLYEDVKARRLNDLVTINVVENISGSGNADTNTGRQSTLDAGVDKFFGYPLNGNFNNLFGHGNSFSPSVSGHMTDSFKGTAIPYPETLRATPEPVFPG